MMAMQNPAENRILKVYVNNDHIGDLEVPDFTPKDKLIAELDKKFSPHNFANAVFDFVNNTVKLNES